MQDLDIRELKLRQLDIQGLKEKSRQMELSIEMEERVRTFSNIMMMYECAIREVKTKLEVLDSEFSVRYNRNPISSIRSRIKKPASIHNKLQKYGLEISEDSVLNGLNDIAGIRVVCTFMEDIYMVASLLASQDDITVLKIKDYIKNPKPNGYRSYHMIVEIPVFFSKGKTPMRVEIQIRTIAMDFWASLEHQLRYKKDIQAMEGHEEISKRLLSCAEVIAETDKQMQEIKRMIGEFKDLS
ncbi:MAG: GTP pyrophosphokinase family protein [Lachnospiraceae bacterium]|nr:GTP pyrophosphokinase family protein [Lachnospiraceae bacterium]